MIKFLFPNRAAKSALKSRIKARKLERGYHARMQANNPDNWGLIRQKGVL